MRSYATEIRAFTRGEGKISMNVGPYRPCHNTEEVILARGYDAAADERHTASSVFCKAGAGYSVPWNEADELMHAVPDVMKPRTAHTDEAQENGAPATVAKFDYRGTIEQDKELMRIFERTYGKPKPRKISEKTVNEAPKRSERPKKQAPKGDNYVIIDGYNFIFAIEELSRMAKADFARARDVLVRLMCDYSAFSKAKVIVVFDAYRRAGGEGSVEVLGGVTVVYTKEKQTADAYIERATYEIASEHTVRVVTSDMQEQLIILGVGGLRVSAREFWQELSDTALSIRETIEKYKDKL